MQAVFSNHQSNTKNISTKFHEKNVDESQEIEEHEPKICAKMAPSRGRENVNNWPWAIPRMFVKNFIKNIKWFPRNWGIHCMSKMDLKYPPKWSRVEETISIKFFWCRDHYKHFYKIFWKNAAGWSSPRNRGTYGSKWAQIQPDGPQEEMLWKNGF